jgi:hypothetical protein
MNNPIFIESLEVMEKAIHEKWASSPVGDKEGQHELRLMLKCFHDFKKNIEEVINTGKMATFQLQQENMLARAKKAFRLA